MLIAPPALISGAQQGLCASLVPLGPVANGFQHLPLRPTILRI
jgi:hypothetical protein